MSHLHLPHHEKSTTVSSIGQAQGQCPEFLLHGPLKPTQSASGHSTMVTAHGQERTQWMGRMWVTRGESELLCSPESMYSQVWEEPDNQSASQTLAGLHHLCPASRWFFPGWLTGISPSTTVTSLHMCLFPCVLSLPPVIWEGKDWGFLGGVWSCSSQVKPSGCCFPAEYAQQCLTSLSFIFFINN